MAKIQTKDWIVLAALAGVTWYTLSAKEDKPITPPDDAPNAPNQNTTPNAPTPTGYLQTGGCTVGSIQLDTTIQTANRCTIALLQQALNYVNSSNLLSVDGVFGNKTKASAIQVLGFDPSVVTLRSINCRVANSGIYTGKGAFGYALRTLYANQINC